MKNYEKSSNIDLFTLESSSSSTTLGSSVLVNVSVVVVNNGWSVL